MRKKNLFSLLAVPLVTVLLVTGCSVSSPDNNAGPTPSPTSSSQPANPSESPAPVESETPAAPVEVEAGQVVDAGTAKTLAAESKGRYKGYAMPDGSYLVVDKQAPLPEPVQDAVDARAVTVQSQNPDVGVGDPVRAGSQLQSQLTGETGKNVILITHSLGRDSPDSAPRTVYLVFGAGAMKGNMSSLGEAQAVAQGHINSQSNPSEWAIVVAN